MNACAAFALLSLGASPRAEVVLDWSGVPDAVIRRCGMEGLQNLLLQALVDEDYAVVRDDGRRGVRFTLSADAEAFRLRAAARDRTAEDAIPVPEVCDSTIVVEIEHAMLRLIEAVRAPDLRAKTSTSVAPRPQVREPHLLLQGGVGGIIPGSSTTLFVARAAGRYPLSPSLLGGLALEAGFRDSLGVVVVEPVLGLEVLERIALPGELWLTFGLEAGGLLHVYHRDGVSHGRADARFGAPIELSLPILGAGAAFMPFFRLTPIAQRVGSDTAYEAARVGLLLMFFVSTR